jgi:hypothetical protein
MTHFDSLLRTLLASLALIGIFAGVLLHAEFQVTLSLAQ